MQRVADDAALLRAHAAGDRDAFAELVRRHKDRLWAVALRTLGDREEAADGLQDALLSAFRNAGSYRGDAAVTPWLHRVVVNACLDRGRRRQALPAEPPGDRVAASSRVVHRRVAVRRDVPGALRAPPEPQRLALVLVDMEDVPVAEAALLLGIPEGTVKSRCARGRAALALILAPETLQAAG